MYAAPEVDDNGDLEGGVELDEVEHVGVKRSVQDLRRVLSR